MVILLVALAVLIGLPLLAAEIARRLGYGDRSSVILFVFGAETFAQGLFSLFARPGWLPAYFVVMGLGFIYIGRWRWQASRPATGAAATRRPSA